MNKDLEKAKGIFLELANKEIHLIKESKKQIKDVMKEALEANTEEEYIINYSKIILKAI